MNPAIRESRAAVLLVGLLLGLPPACAVDSRADDASAPAAAPAAATAAPATAASIGLLPIHAISLDLDALLAGKPGKRGKGEEFAPLQQLWDSYLKGAGFNVLEFGVDVHDLGEGGAGRLARLCAWAKRNDVRIAPTLLGSAEGAPLPPDYPNLAASFVGKAIASLGATELASYSQVVFYQLERPLNHPASHGAIEPEAAEAVIKAAAEAVRAAEQAGLAAAGLQPTPLLVSGSFDCELIRRGAIAGTPISDEAYSQAYDGLHEYLAGVFAAAPVEAASVQWFPGSLSSDGLDRLADLVNRLEGDLPGRLIIVDTGYSSAAGSDTAQARYYQVALTNLCDLRANQGVDSPFAGILWHSAFDAGSGENRAASAPAAGDVAKLWADPKADARGARAWVSSIQSHFGLLSRANDAGQGFAPKTAFRVMSGLESALAQSPQASDALAAVKELGAAGQSGTMGRAVKSKLQSALFGMLDAWLSKTADDLFAEPEAPAPTSGTTAQALPDIQIWPPLDVPSGPKVGTPVSVTFTLFNAGNAIASDATVYLRDGNHTDLARSNPVAVSPQGQTSVTLTWTPSVAGVVQGIAAEVFCTNDADPSPNSNRAPIGNLTVQAGSKPPRPFPAADFAVLADRAVLVSSSSTTTTPPPSGGGSASAGGTRTMMATTSAAGFVAIEGLSAPQVMMAPAPASGSGEGSATTRSMTGAAPTSSGSATPVASAAPAAGSAASSPVTMTLANPFATPFRDAVATLRVNDAVVSTRSLGTLLPRQRRTVTFAEWSPPRPGTYRLRADLAGVGPAGNRLASSASSSITVAAGGARTMAAPGSETATRPFAPTRSFTPLVSTASSQPVRGFGAPSRGFGAGESRAFAARPALGLSANSIVMQPFPAAPAAGVAISVQLSNFTRTPASGARVAVFVDREPLGEVVTDVPASGAAVASGFRSWTATPGRHEVRATVSVAGDRSEASKPFVVGAGGPRAFEPAKPGPTVGFKPGFGQPVVSRDPVGGSPGFKPMTPGGRPAGVPAAAGPARADLQVTAKDIQFAPAVPASGGAFTVNIAVHNLGAAAASEAQVLAVLTAGGREVARRSFPVAVGAGATASLQWPLTAPAESPLAVAVTVTCLADPNPANNQATATAAPAGVRTPPRAFGVGRERTP